MTAKVKKGDTVIVLTGKDKGKKGEVLKLLCSKNRAIVQGVNIAKRHVRASQATPGGITEREASINLSNLAHVDPKDDKPTRVGVRTLENGRKVRYAKRSGEIIDN